MKFDLNDSSQSIPTNNTADIPLYSGTQEGLKITAGALSTAYLAYKAYKEIRKLYKEEQQRQTDENPSDKSRESQRQLVENARSKSKKNLKRKLPVGAL